MSTINVEAELEPGFQYAACCLRRPPLRKRPKPSARGWRFLLVAPSRVTAPLLAAAYAARLSEIVVPDFTIWLWGGTGSFKSTLAALILSHLGDFSETNLPPLLREHLKRPGEKPVSGSPGRNRGGGERLSVPASPQPTRARWTARRSGSSGTWETARRKGGMTRDTMLRASYPPRGVVAGDRRSTPRGSDIPECRGARSLSINDPCQDDVDLAELSELQRDKLMLPCGHDGLPSPTSPGLPRAAS